MGLIYFVVIIFANTLGAISGMGGGVLIKPILDFIGHDSIAAVSFYSTVAVFTMSIVSTLRQIAQGNKVKFQIIFWISIGAVLGGILGNTSFEILLKITPNEKYVQFIQIIITIFTLFFALFYSKYQWVQFKFSGIAYYIVCGLILGFLSSLLGIGGGPINVSLLMMMFGFQIKEATIYSIATIFFSQLSKLITIGTTVGFTRYDLSMLYFVIPAAVIGGFIGAKFSKVLPSEKVTKLFQSIIIFVILINIYNGIRLFL